MAANRMHDRFLRVCSSNMLHAFLCNKPAPMSMCYGTVLREEINEIELQCCGKDQNKHSIHLCNNLTTQSFAYTVAKCALLHQRIWRGQYLQLQVWCTKYAERIHRTIWAKICRKGQRTTLAMHV